mmetsp:Transcript_31969/g.95744  ORF Transcript_31969/g.95744 Transcript_31969/m.95744 type:complete len:512 (-) Transcript_31969:259-1794(-)
MCCCCCPPAITALFCLWVKSGFSKASVAGALTFFPPEPALYKFERVDKNGEVMEDDEESLIDDFGEEEDDEMYEEDDGDDVEEGGEIREEAGGEEESQENKEDERDAGNDQEDEAENDEAMDVDETDEEAMERLKVLRESELEDTRHSSKKGGEGSGKERHSSAYSGRRPDEEIVPVDKNGTPRGGNEKSAENPVAQKDTAAKTKMAPPPPKEEDAKKEKKKKKKNTSPAAALTERSKALRRRARKRNARAAADAAAGVTYRFVPDPRLAPPPRFSGTVEAVKVGPQKRTGTYIAALMYRVSSDVRTDRTKTIIYSHGNATDVGAMCYMQAVLAKCLDCNVVVYDYSGYGASGGVPLEANTYRDVKLVYDYVVRELCDGDESKVVLYGQSVGSGPSCYLCSRRENVGGLILHSPFTSGMRVLTPSRALACLDIFPNIDRISKVRCPVMVIHGQNDEEVGVQHGIALHRAVPQEYRRDPWWVPDRGHNDITDGSNKMGEYIHRLRAYLDGLD